MKIVCDRCYLEFEVREEDIFKPKKDNCWFYGINGYCGWVYCPKCDEECYIMAEEGCDD